MLLLLVVSLQTTSTSDDPLTTPQDDPTIISLVVTPSVEITKTASETDSDGSGSTTAGDIITYTITVSNPVRLRLMISLLQMFYRDWILERLVFLLPLLI